MNILHIDTECTWRGGEQQLFYLVDGLQKRGHKNIIVCQPGSSLAQRAIRENFRVSLLRMRGEWDILAIYRIRKIIKENSIQIVHLHTAHAQTLGVLAALRLPRCKTVVSRRVDFHLRSPLSRFIKYRKADCIVAISGGIRTVLIEDGISQDKIRIIHSGIDISKFQNVNGRHLFHELDLDREGILVGIVAALAPHKDHRNFILAAEKVKQEIPNVIFLIVGEGRLKNKLVFLIRKLGLEKEVRFLGFRRDIPEILSILDIFVISSYLEGLGTSILDAMASGLPVVATSVGGIKEIVKDGKTGILVPPHDPSALAFGIIKLIRNPDLRKRYGEEGRRLVGEYSCDKMVRETENLYGELLCKN